VPYRFQVETELYYLKKGLDSISISSLLSSSKLSFINYLCSGICLNYYFKDIFASY